MTNKQKMYCTHCNRHTDFFLESDMLWYCHDCGNAYDSISGIEDDTIGDVIRCPFCHNLIEVAESEGEYICPVCFEDLSEQLGMRRVDSMDESDTEA